MSIKIRDIRNGSSFENQLRLQDNFHDEMTQKDEDYKVEEYKDKGEEYEDVGL